MLTLGINALPLDFADHRIQKPVYLPELVKSAQNEEMFLETQRYCGTEEIHLIQLEACHGYEWNKMRNRFERTPNIDGIQQKPNKRWTSGKINAI